MLQTEVLVFPAFDPVKTQNRPTPKKFIGIWDTGATNSVISKRIIDECGLKPISMTEVHTVGGTKTSEVFLVNVGLPNRVGISEIRVCEGSITGSADMLVGMDIISRGDLALTNKDGKTTFSFRMPSIESIDFVKQKPPGAKKLPKVGRNDPCPCGSGKKYKYCHGK